MTKKTKAKKATKIKRPVSPKTRRSTAGPGFAFEDQVAAWFILKILIGQPLPGIEGNGTRLQMQTGSLGWLIDDVLLAARTVSGDDRHIAISCKSNVQVTSSGLPSDFVERAWKQWSGSNAGPMKRGKDCLMLATRGHHAKFMAVWSDLKNCVQNSDVNFALTEMRLSANRRKVLESIMAPAKAAKISVTDTDVVALIQSIEIAPFDFDMAGSRSEGTAIAESRTLLANNNLAGGRKLWAELVTRTRETRLGTGTLVIADILRSLRKAFDLKDYPDFETSWRRLRALTADFKAVIETTLPSGLTIDRQSASEALTRITTSKPVCVIYGDSGTGKSALVKTVLDARFAKTDQVWLGPDHIEAALSEANRATLGLHQPLLDVLNASARPENILVIDAAERLSQECTSKARALIACLLKGNSPASGVDWRILIVGQTEAFAIGDLQKLANEKEPPCLEVRTLSEDVVKNVLRSTEGLNWLASHDDAVAAFTNLRALGWVVQAASQFQNQVASGPVSLTTIADLLWRYWTDDKADIQRLLMKLAERDATFEHSFALSQLDGMDTAAFGRRSNQCPLRINRSTNQIQFKHDLAADWARFQRLKEVAGDTTKWAVYAGNPMWNGALRMLGQFLLRQRVGSRSAWDVAFDAAERGRDTMPLADDILLDALFLDPSAYAFLDERTEMLLANNAERLLRLLRRFDHVASAPSVNPDMLGVYRGLELYLEAHYRTPIIGRWPAVARFLARHRERVAELISPEVAAVCLRWLESTPPTLTAGTPVLFRKEFSELALASARALQLEQAKHVLRLGDSEGRIHQAAFAGALDLPNDVAEWALEMAQRRPFRADIVEKIGAYRKQQAEEHKRRLENDADYRKQHQRRMAGGPTFIGSGRELPPWPLGPRESVDERFRDAVLRSPTFQFLMRANPKVAGEVLLAVIIEDSPEEKYDTRPRLDEELGVAFDHESYPTAFWKSPFFSFLQINADVALDVLQQLINFCTDRWEYEARRSSGSKPATISLRLADGALREYRGSYDVFKWSQENSLHTGQLHSALAALERWLCSLIDRGIDMTPYIERLLRTSNSVAVIGVLVNVGKYRVDLFRGPLKPLLAVHRFYVWDYHRVDESAHSFDGMAWVRSGNMIFEMAKNWILASYRKKNLQQIASEIITRDTNIAEFILESSAQWASPSDEKSALELRILVAELDHRNYRLVRDGVTGKEQIEFTYPKEIAESINGFQQDNTRAQQVLAFPSACRKILNSSGILTPQQGGAVASLMAAADGDEAIDLDEEMIRPARVAAAVVLLLRAQDWLMEHGPIQLRARAIVDATITEISDAADGSRFHYSMAPSFLEFAAYFAVESWIANPSRAADEMVMRVFTSGDDRAAQAIAWLAYRSRAVLGSRWWRLLYLALLWSGLSMLAPHVDDDELVKPRWQRWRRWLRTRSLSGPIATVDTIKPLAVAMRIEKFVSRRRQHRYLRDGRQFNAEPGQLLSRGLDTHFLERAFSWLFDDQAGRVTSPGEIEDRKALVEAFWAHEAWYLSGSVENADKDYATMSQLGYNILAELARLTSKIPANLSSALWVSVFELGPKGHYSIGEFLRNWFNQITEATNIEEFRQRWRPMIEYMLGNKDWATGRQWHYGQQLERQVLGFGASADLARVADHASLVRSMRDLYKSWADKRLNYYEDNLAGFCDFLSTEPGTCLRIEGLQWIAAAMRSEPDVGKWYRESTSNAFIAFLDALITEHAADISKIADARQALLELVAHAVSRQLPAALALQERARKAL